jgi:hypothetical protein
MLQTQTANLIDIYLSTTRLHSNIITLKRNFSSNNSALLTKADSASKPSDLSSTSTLPEYTTRFGLTAKFSSNDLNTGEKFDVAIEKAGYPEGPEGAAKVNEIVDSLRAERSEKVDQFKAEIDEDRGEYMQQLDNDYSSGKISASENVQGRKTVEYYYRQQIEEHNQCCDKELKEFMDVVFSYKKDNNMPMQDSSDISSTTDMPDITEDE